MLWVARGSVEIVIPGRVDPDDEDVIHFREPDGSEWTALMSDLDEGDMREHMPTAVLPEEFDTADVAEWT